MNVLAAIYIVFAATFFLFTFVEGQRKHLAWSFYRLVGLAMSIVWPAALLVAFISSRSRGAAAGRIDRQDRP